MKGAPAAPSPPAPRQPSLLPSAPATPRPPAAGARLPPAMVQGIPVRVSVLGTRGKSTLAALVAAALKRRNLTVCCNAPRPEQAEPDRRAAWERQAEALGMALGDRRVADEAATLVRAAWPVQALVLANRARSPDGQRRLHTEVCMPHYALVTNVRRDPAGLAIRPLAAEARRLVRAITPGALVICGEPDPAIRALLRRESERAGLAFLDAAPRRATPAAEILSILDAFLLHRFGKGLEADEQAALVKETDARFRWQPSSIPGVRWFDGGALHDVDSAQIALNHLQGQRRVPVTFVAYFRGDRPGRTRAHSAFLEELLAAPDTRQVILCGTRASAVAERLDRWGSQVRVVPDDVSAIPRLVRRLQFDCQGGAIVTLANDAGPWPEELARQLRRSSGSPVPPAVAPTKTKAESVAPSSQVPRRIVRPVVAAASVPSAMAPPPLSAPAPTLPAPVAATAPAIGAAVPTGIPVPLAAATVTAAALPSALPTLTRPPLPRPEALR